MEKIRRYFPEFTDSQLDKLGELGELLKFWNTKVNLVSRKDIDHIYTHHILHSLSIAKLVRFPADSIVMDAGTGGGLPGIPLAIAFPSSRFILADSIAKKIRVVERIVQELALPNCEPIVSRVEKTDQKVNFVVSRAVTRFPDFYLLVKNCFLEESMSGLANGILYLKGGELEEELRKFRNKVRITDINSYFEEAYFGTKKIIYLPVI